MNIFPTLPAGDSTSWQDTSVLLPDGRTATSAGWTLSYYLRGVSTLDLTAAAAGSGWTTDVSASQSADLAAGTYGWVAVLTNTAGERITVGSGQLTITPNLVTAGAGFDPQSIAQRALAQCEAAMATFNATGGKVKKYTIAGRDMEFQALADLMKLQQFWKAKVLAEQTSSMVAQGEGNPRNLYVRFTPPSV